MHGFIPQQRVTMAVVGPADRMWVSFGQDVGRHGHARFTRHATIWVRRFNHDISENIAK